MSGEMSSRYTLFAFSKKCWHHTSLPLDKAGNLYSTPPLFGPISVYKDDKRVFRTPHKSQFRTIPPYHCAKLVLSQALMNVLFSGQWSLLLQHNRNIILKSSQTVPHVHFQSSCLSCPSHLTFSIARCGNEALNRVSRILYLQKKKIQYPGYCR